MHECDDRVERIALMCVSMWLGWLHALDDSRALSWLQRASLQESEARWHKKQISQSTRALEQQHPARCECADHRKIVLHPHIWTVWVLYRTVR